MTEFGKKMLQHPRQYGVDYPVIDESRFNATFMVHQPTGDWLPVYRQMDKEKYKGIVEGYSKTTEKG